VSVGQGLVALVVVAALGGFMLLLGRQQREMLRMVLDRDRGQAEALAKIAVFGTPNPEGMARELPATANPELRARLAVEEDTVLAGVAAMRDAYAAKGLHLSHEEAREQVVAMLAGRPLP
jgi:hypothetical protein